MTIFGYARASISQPSLDPQIDILSRHGVSAAHLFTDAPAGRRAERAGLQGLQGAVRSGAEDAAGVYDALYLLGLPEEAFALARAYSTGS